MVAQDILLVSTRDGTDGVLQSEDLLLTSGLETAVYIAVCGGNDYWANGLLLSEEKYNGRTMSVCSSVALNSSGRLKIEQAIKDDLHLLAANEGLDLRVVVQVSGDRADMTIWLGNMQYLYTYYADGKNIIIQKRTT